MIVWRLNKRVLSVLGLILLVYGFITFRLTQNDGKITFNSYSNRQIVLESTQTAIGDPRGIQRTTKTTLSTEWESEDLIMNVAAVVCGDRVDEATTMIKSILIFTTRKVHFHVVAEQELQVGLMKNFESFPASRRRHTQLSIYNLSFPHGEDQQAWKKLFKTCASQRLFLPDFIEENLILYLDTDTLVLSPLEKLWHHFSKFNKTQLAAMTKEGEIPALNWYNRFARHPYFGDLGLNSGVMLMDLHKLKKIDFTQKIIKIYRDYKYNIAWGDQDLLNIFFEKNPALVYVYPCEWNYRPDHCMYLNNCQTAMRNGVYVLHGNRGVFHNDKHKTFKEVYNIVKQYKFGDSIETKIVAKILRLENEVSDRYCKLMVKTLVKNMLEPNG